MREVIRVEGVSKSFTLPALKGVTFSVMPGEFLSIVGPSGCGKSTLLRIISGLTAPHEGQVWVEGERIISLNRRVGFVFQRDALLPWKTVYENIILSHRFKGSERERADAETRSWIDIVGLRGFENHYPGQLSGGMRKRAALAQVMISGSSIILMDEPFGALDVQTRDIIENELLRIWQEFKKTIVFVTHDLEEAISLSDRIIVLTAAPGRVKGEYWVELPRPRNVIEVRFLDEFRTIYQKIWSDLREEVLASYEAGRKR